MNEIRLGCALIQSNPTEQREWLLADHELFTKNGSWDLKELDLIFLMILLTLWSKKAEWSMDSNVSLDHLTDQESIVNN